ncbi:hypothetical protein CC1G_04171 [Coprinopsis cinerea okayama7|uniref:Uncharacterized protein n=1 Tax=Coprinopsis cinerea (strain Okayama-7 / 130 / ATCC MYA-4618 / FGSC 9003) TaxID=240176 RepID=A8NW87_COPC7|nr:hypothetical protein CC1G_04171 [Coprinopsis cinerea okayama7\|eukprot:XP_001836858.1 hypothetical protein CC1G_04171 [Coprinopsis cinerea okayama7\
MANLTLHADIYRTGQGKVSEEELVNEITAKFKPGIFTIRHHHRLHDYGSAEYDELDLRREQLAAPAEPVALVAPVEAVEAVAPAEPVVNRGIKR